MATHTWHQLELKKIYSLLSCHDEFVFLDTSKPDKENYASYLFLNPKKHLITHGENVEDFFEKLENESRTFYLAGYATYELGYALNPQLASLQKTQAPFAHFGIFDSVVRFDHKTGVWDGKPAFDTEENYKVQPIILKPSLGIDKESYITKTNQVLDALRAGYSYQVNFTDNFTFPITGSIFSLYHHLRQQQETAYSALIKLGNRVILSFSPELFFRKTPRLLQTKPMKGTEKRGRTEQEDLALMKSLANDQKSQAENIMIVDLLRNDMGSLCEHGSVKVKKMFEVERYSSVLQMTSTIVGKPIKTKTWRDYFQSLFPCGSVTGAPKLETMKIIRRLEKKERGVYCGAIGFIEPNKKAVFSVAIRTIELKGKKATMGSGGGIVIDSVPEKEYEELQLKGKFLNRSTPDFALLESILWNGKRYVYLNGHLARMASSARYFQYPFERKKILQTLDVLSLSLPKKQSCKIRLLLQKDGSIETTHTAIKSKDMYGKIAISKMPVSSQNVFLFHKTTHRPLYTEALQFAKKYDLDDVLFVNERDEVTEGARTNVLIEIRGKLYTPPIDSGLLAGIYRKQLLIRGKVQEKVILLDEIKQANAMYLCNSIRGMWEVEIELK